jgi:hypothetical protein
MARTSLLRPRRSPQPGKLQLYQQQYALNLALENFVLGCQQLQTLNLVPRQFLTVYTNMAEELRTLINSKINETMRPIEAEDARHFQRERLKWDSRPYPKIAKKMGR